MNCLKLYNHHKNYSIEDRGVNLGEGNEEVIVAYSGPAGETNVSRAKIYRLK